MERRKREDEEAWHKRNQELIYEFEHPNPRGSWKDLVPDLQLRAGLQYLLDSCPWWKPYWKEGKCPIEWADVDDRTHAQYSLRDKKVQISNRFRWDWKDVLGALIAHEIVHSVWHRRCEALGIAFTRELALALEYEACVVEARAWEQLTLNPGVKEGSNGQLNRLLSRYHNGTLAPYVQKAVANYTPMNEVSD
jgi:hypothetical protein